MSALFTPEEQRALRALTGAPGQSRVALARVREGLGLAPLPHAELLAAERWLAGGSVTRWLGRGLGRGPQDQGDVDLFFPHLDALLACGSDLLGSGFTFRTYRAGRFFCQLCGGPAEEVPEGRVPHPELSLWRARCPHCGDFGGADAHTLPVERLFRPTPQQVRDLGLRALELASPAGEIVHLSIIAIRPTPEEVLGLTDLTLNQFATDGETLFFLPRAWPDLLAGRLRWVRRQKPWQNCARIRKYRGLGFRPTPITWLRFVYWSWRTRKDAPVTTAR